MKSCDCSVNNRKQLLQRYSRQMLLPEIGLEGQYSMMNHRVLVVGAGGIGSTVIMYLASAGVSLAIVDFDSVEVSNLHRQILHDSRNEGMNKAESAALRVKSINPYCNVQSISEKLTAMNAVELLTPFDIIVDASDNYTARYIINDTCVLLQKPLISGSAVGFEGQITVIKPGITPCYRCLYPEPNLECRSCSDAGVLGPIPGMIGCLQATEAMKLLVSMSNVRTEDSKYLKLLLGRQTFYDGATGSFHTFQLPSRSPSCAVCGDNPIIKNLSDTAANLSQIEAAVPEEGSLVPQISVQDYYKMLQHPNNDKIAKVKHLLLDVRNSTQYGMVSLHEYYSTVTAYDNIDTCISSLETENPSSATAISINVPLHDLQGGYSADVRLSLHKSIIEKLNKVRTFITNFNQKEDIDGENEREPAHIYVLCRRGISSTEATRLLHQVGLGPNIFNITGGLTAWQSIDSNFPMY